jgi:protein TonB
MTLTLHLKRCVFIFVLLISVQQTFSQLTPAIRENKKDTVDTKDLVFTRTEIEASFPGGDAAWNKYVLNQMKNADFDRFKNSDQGTCRVRFIVDKQGNVSNVQAITMKKSRLAKLAVEIMQNGKAVNAYREQPITFQFEKAKNEKDN